jgi:hypothetical protein
MVEHAREQTRQRLLTQRTATELRLKRIREREKRQRDRYVNGESKPKKKVDAVVPLPQPSYSLYHRK